MTEPDAASEAVLQRAYKFAPAADPVEAANPLNQARQIAKELGVSFFRSATPRSSRNDDVDTGGAIGFHSLTEESVYRVVYAFRDSGCFTKVARWVAPPDALHVRDVVFAFY